MRCTKCDGRGERTAMITLCAATDRLPAIVVASTVPCEDCVGGVASCCEDAGAEGRE